MRRKKRLGEMLMEAGLLTDAQLQEALVAQKQTQLKLGQFLIRQGTISEFQLVDLLSRQLKVERYHPDKFPLDLDLARIIPAEIAQKDQIVPIKKTGNLLTIAMIDPMDIRGLDEVEVMTNHEVEPVICTEQELQQLIGSLYGAYSNLGGVMESLEKTPEETPPEEESPAGRPSEDVEVGSLKDMAEEAPVVRLVSSVLSQAVRENVSDIHISPEKDYVQVRFRVDGKLHEVPAPPKAMFLPLVSRIKVLSNMDISLSRIPQDGRFTIKDQDKEINIRVSTAPTIYGENLVLRLLNTSAGIYSLDALGMFKGDREKLESSVTKPYGMILRTGPTSVGVECTQERRPIC